MEGGWAQTVLGTSAGLLLPMVYPAIHRVRSFTSNLNGLQSTLSLVNNAIEILNIIRPRHEITEQFAAQVAEAEQLRRRCSVVSKWNIFMRWYYSDVLSSFETTLSRKFQSHTAVLLLLQLASVRHELQETSPDGGVAAEVEEGDEGNRSAEMDDDETPHYHASEIEIVTSDGN